jgi:non-specific serine/threonine protein kinase/serine/threonine-protein kinase
MPDHGEHVAALFEAAVSLDPGQRSAFLDRACGDKGSLRQEVEELLLADAAAGSFLRHPVFDLPTADDSHASQRTIGPYTLLEVIGEGGMGEVWLAEQRQPVRRRVAIKLIKVGMDTKEVVARFESERQALALMDHSVIAKVFDAGSTPEGRPYFVMEYVAGLPITDYCDKHKLTIRHRLELFTRVCEGVQHAHQKAIIHRDLKPSNILVSEVDGKPSPRIIDFGVAKAIAQKLTDRTMYTQIGMLIGTLGYISPEQADSGGEDIDTRTDVYSLGAVLFELLAGSLPLDLEKLAYDEVLHRLREEDAPRPSTKLRTLGEVSDVAATNRGTDLSTLCRQLSGDPDSIALKALEKDRARRYASASELAGDIARYLRNEPVAAHPPSTAYRARKYLRRHRVGVTVAAALALLLVAIAIGQTVELRHVARERDRATRERDRADRISQFMTGMFKVSNPSEARGNTVTAREILDKGEKEIDNGLKNEPELQAKMMYTMAETYQGLGLESRAQPLLERALQIQRRLLGHEHPDTLRSMGTLAAVLAYEGHYVEAEKLQRETLEIRRRVLGPDHPDTLESRNLLAATLEYGGHLVEAEKLERETLDIRRRVLGSENEDTLASMSLLAYTLAGEGRFTESEKLFRETIDIQRRVLGPEHPDTLLSISNLVSTLVGENDYGEAERLSRGALQIQRRVLGPEHPDTLYSMSNLAYALMEKGSYAEAEKLQHETLEIQRRVLGPEHPDAIASMENLAGILIAETRYPEAENLNRETLDIIRRVFGPESDNSLGRMNSLAETLIYQGRYAEAESMIRETLDKGRRVAGPEVPVMQIALENEALNLSHENRYDEAKELYREAIQTAERTGEPSMIAFAWYQFARGAAIAGHHDEALQYLDKAIALGHWASVVISSEPDLRSLHGSGHFEALIAKAH